MPTNRRDALKGGIAFVRAAAGLAAASAAVNAADNKSLVVYGRGWRISSQNLDRGALPPAGVRMLFRGEIVDKPLRGRKTATSSLLITG